MADERIVSVESLQQLQKERGRSPIVGIKELTDLGLDVVPPLYVRPLSDRPTTAFSAGNGHGLTQERIPTIDIRALTSDTGSDGAARSQVVHEIGRACEEWGFFQVINHGVETSVIQGLREAARRFFDLPAEERMSLYSQSFKPSVAYSTSFNPSVEKVREWKDTLCINRVPGVGDGFSEAPRICRKEAQEYIAAVECLARRLYEAFFESLGLDKAYVEAAVPNIPRALMRINYYPPCPDPSLTLGLSGHSDVGCLTLLHPDVVPGLEIKRKGMWLPVFPADPTAFVVNLSDQTEILTNGKYKSIEHRAITNREKPRMSIACFFGPHEETVMAPLPLLLNESNPPRYKPTKFSDNMQNFASKPLLSNRGTLDFAKI